MKLYLKLIAYILSITGLIEGVYWSFVLLNVASDFAVFAGVLLLVSTVVLSIAAINRLAGSSIKKFFQEI